METEWEDKNIGDVCPIKDCGGIIDLKKGRRFLRVQRDQDDTRKRRATETEEQKFYDGV